MRKEGHDFHVDVDDLDWIGRGNKNLRCEHGVYYLGVTPLTLAAY